MQQQMLKQATTTGKKNCNENFHTAHNLYITISNKHVSKMLYPYKKHDYKKMTIEGSNAHIQ